MSDQHIVYKHQIDQLGNLTTLQLPAGSKVIKFDYQNGLFCLWESHEVDKDEKRIERSFIMVGTGHETPVNCWVVEHVGTCLVSNGSYVFHLFEVVPKLPSSK